MTVPLKQNTPGRKTNKILLDGFLFIFNVIFNIYLIYFLKRHKYCLRVLWRGLDLLLSSLYPSGTYKLGRTQEYFRGDWYYFPGGWYFLRGVVNKNIRETIDFTDPGGGAIAFTTLLYMPLVYLYWLTPAEDKD